MTHSHWNPGREPTGLDLRDLERLGDRRAEIESATPSGRRQAEARRLELATLDEMEEALCLYGRRTPAVVEGWRRLACLESVGRNGSGRNGNGRRGNGRRGNGEAGAAASSTTEGGAPK